MTMHHGKQMHFLLKPHKKVRKWSNCRKYMSCSLFNVSTTFCQTDGSNNNVVKIKHGRLNFQSHLSKVGSGFLKWGSLRYLFLVSVLTTADAVGMTQVWGSSRNKGGGIKVVLAELILSPSKKSHQRKSVSVKMCALLRIFSPLYLSLPTGNWSRYILLWSLQSRQTSFTKTVILPGRTQELLVHHCFDRLVHVCYYVNHHQSLTFTREN